MVVVAHICVINCCFNISEQLFFLFLSYGECIMPNKALDKADSYQGHWRDGKVHGFGKYKSVHCFFTVFVET